MNECENAMALAKDSETVASGIWQDIPCKMERAYLTEEFCGKTGSFIAALPLIKRLIYNMEKFKKRYGTYQHFSSRSIE